MKFSDLLSVCDAFWVLSALALLILSWMDPFWMKVWGSLLFAAFLALRFRSFRILVIWTFLGTAFLFSAKLQNFQAPEEGVYRIVSVHSGYALAEKGFQKAVIYSDESLMPDMEVRLSGFKPVHSLRNPGSFSFSSFLKRKGAGFFADQVSVYREDPGTLRSNVWKWIEKRQGASLYRMLFYGWSESESLEWLGSSGLPLMSLLAAWRSLLEKRFESGTVGWMAALSTAGMLCLFPYQESLIRLLFFTLCSLVFSRRHLQWAFGVILMLLFSPASGSSMSLLLPAGLSFLSFFEQGPLARRSVQIGWCALMQILRTQKLSLLFLVGFQRLRRMMGWFFLLSLPGLWLPFWGSALEKLARGFELSLEWGRIQADPPFWYAGALMFLFGKLVWNWKPVRLTAFLGVLGLYPWIWRLDPFFHVYQLDVGQGDAAVIVEPFMKSVVMIDAAGRFNHDNASEIFLPFFQSRQIEKLDALILTHSDWDHCGAAQSLASQFEIRRTVLEASDSLNLSYPFVFLLPERPSSFLKENSDLEDPNDLSLICTFAYDGFRYLYTGDASVLCEEQLVRRYALKSDVLKLGHHGSSSSSADLFLKEVGPQLALISSGYRNRYNHPSNEVLQRLDAFGIDRLNTADHGSIHLFSFRNILWFHTADGLIGSLKPSTDR